MQSRREDVAIRRLVEKWKPTLLSLRSDSGGGGSASGGRGSSSGSSSSTSSGRGSVSGGAGAGAGAAAYEGPVVAPPSAGATCLEAGGGCSSAMQTSKRSKRGKGRAAGAAPRAAGIVKKGGRAKRVRIGKKEAKTPRVGEFQAILPTLLERPSRSTVTGKRYSLEWLEVFPQDEQPLNRGMDVGRVEEAVGNGHEDEMLMSSDEHAARLQGLRVWHQLGVAPAAGHSSHASRLAYYKALLNQLPKKNPSSSQSPEKNPDSRREWTEQETKLFDAEVQKHGLDVVKMQGLLPERGIDEIYARHRLHDLCKGRKQDMTHSNFEEMSKEIRDELEPTVCDVCKADGLLVFCDANLCCRAFHKSCAGLTSVPEGDWICPSCLEEVAILADLVASYEKAIAAEAAAASLDRPLEGGKRYLSSKKKGKVSVEVSALTSTP
eukprot:g11008.t2